MFRAYKKIEYFALKIIEKIEKQKITLTSWLIVFFAIVFLRKFLEIISTRNDYLRPELHPFLFFHAPAFFLFLVLLIILILRFLTNEKIEKISKIALFAFFIILLPPIIDLIAASGEGGIIMRYKLFFRLPENILQFFLNIILYSTQGLLSLDVNSKVVKFLELNFNYGIRIQSSILFLGLIWYVFLKTKNIFKVFLGMFFLYSIGFLFLIFSPLRIYNLSSSLNPLFEHNFVLFSLYFIFVCVLGLLWFFAYDKNKLSAFLKNSRLTRVLHNIILLGLGLYLAKVPIFNPLSLNFADCLLIIMAVIAILLYWLSAIGYDDLSDEKIDRISNRSRPLPQNKFTRKEYRILSNLLRALSFVVAFAVGYSFFFLILLRSFVGYLYYTSPFRLKRFPVLATFINALTFLFTIYAGFLLNSANTIFDFPGKLAIFVLIAFTLGGTVKDVKDYHGDKAGGIFTIPVIFGLEKGKKIIGFLAFLSFILCPIFFLDYFDILFLPSFLAGILSFWLIGKKNFTSKEYIFLFSVYLSFGLFFILICFQ